MRDSRETNGKRGQNGHKRPEVGDLHQPDQLRAELEIVSTMVCRPETAKLILSRLEPDDFADPQCGAFFRCYRDAAELSGVPEVDPRSLVPSLAKCPGFDGEDGARQWLINLAKGILASPFASYVDFNGRQVRAGSLRRRSQRIVADVASSLANGDLSESDVERAREALSEALRGPEMDVPQIGEDIHDFMDWLGESGAGRRMSTGFRWLDHTLNGGLADGQLVTIAGPTGGGKTAFALQLVLNACATNRSCLIYSLEMSRRELQQRLLCNLSGVPLNVMGQGGTLLDRQAVTEGIERLAQLPVRIDDTGRITAPQIEAAAESIQRRQDLDLIVVDYLQLVTPTGDPRRNRQEQVAEMSRAFKLAARSLGVPLILLSQIRRREGNAKPKLSDLRESGAIEQDSDVVLFVAGCDGGSSGRVAASISVAKQRNGPQSTIEVEWHGPTMSFADIQGEEPF